MVSAFAVDPIHTAAGPVVPCTVFETAEVDAEAAQRLARGPTVGLSANTTNEAYASALACRGDRLVCTPYRRQLG